MKEEIIVALIPISIVAAFGIKYGFNVIFEKNFIQKYKKYKSEVESNLKKRLMYISLKKYENNVQYEGAVNEYFEVWQDHQDNVKNSYERMMTYRDSIFYLFLISGLFYFLSLESITSNPITLFGSQIISYANLTFIIGFFAIFAFGKELNDINKRISRHELNKPTFEASVQNIKDRVLKK